MKVVKRDGRIVHFDRTKIVRAVEAANKNTDEMELEQINKVVAGVEEKLDNKERVGVELIQDLVEEELISQNYPKTAKEYILYRDKRAKERQRDIFKPRKNLKPYEYPELEKY